MRHDTTRSKAAAGQFATAENLPCYPSEIPTIRVEYLTEAQKRAFAIADNRLAELASWDEATLAISFKEIEELESDVAPQGVTVARATVRQKKTGRPVRFELTEATREAVDEYLKSGDRKSGDYMFPGRGAEARHLTTPQYARLVARWIASIGLNTILFGTHSLRRTTATLIYRRTGTLRAV